MSGVTMTVVGVAELRQRFDAAATGARAKMHRTVQALGLELLAKVKGEKLTGQVLKVRTGRLRRSINEKTTETGTAVESTVGTNVAYGRFWEMGFTGAEQVRAHTRRTRKGNAQVRAHVRQVNQAPRPFLAPALAEMRTRVLERLQVAAAEVARGAGA